MKQFTQYNKDGIITNGYAFALFFPLTVDCAHIHYLNLKLLIYTQLFGVFHQEYTLV